MTFIIEWCGRFHRCEIGHSPLGFAGKEAPLQNDCIDAWGSFEERIRGTQGPT